jgi:predicted nucleotide-binding protein
MNKRIAERLVAQVKSAWEITSVAELVDWRRRLYAFLDGLYEQELLQALKSLEGPLDVFFKGDNWRSSRDEQASYLEGQIVFYGNDGVEDTVVQNQAAKSTVSIPDAKRVFLVHGHDEAARESVARFLEQVGLEVVILHEQPNGGKTVIEKFEQHSAVGFAVVLLTPDDIGASALEAATPRPRARQNVILELGYFAGKLGRSRVCGLFRPGLEVPSDFAGVLLTELDAQGGWKTKLAQELVSASMKIDIQGLLRG